jgi:hypothetical protein
MLSFRAIARAISSLLSLLDCRYCTRAASLLNAPQGSFLHPSTDLVDMCPKASHWHLVGPQISLHPERVGNLAECSSKHEPVKAAHRPGDSIGELCGKLVHAFLSVIKVFSDNSQ